MFYREIKLRNFQTGLIPVDVRNRLRKEYRNLATMNMSLFFDVLKVLKSLADNQLPVIALKGLSLAKDIYGDIALRPMTDADLLVKEEDLVRAGRILLTLGYRQYYPAWESMIKIYHHLPPFTNKNGAMIELHWNIVAPESPIKVDIDGLWERARLIKMDDVEFRAFSPEDLLLHLCTHACYNLQTGLDLIPLCDIAGLIKTSANKIDWQIVIERTARWGSHKCVYLILLLVQELLGVSPPDNILSELKPDDYQAVFFDIALKQIFDENSSDPQIIRRIGYLSTIKKAKGLHGKILAIVKKVFLSKEHMAHIYYPVPVASPKIYLYYLFRLGHMISYFAMVLLRLFRRDQSVTEAVNQEHRVSVVYDWMYS